MAVGRLPSRNDRHRLRPELTPPAIRVRFHLRPGEALRNHVQEFKKPLLVSLDGYPGWVDELGETAVRRYSSERRWLEAQQPKQSDGSDLAQFRLLECQRVRLELP